SEEHTSELQSRFDLVCRLLLEKKNLRVWVRSIVHQLIRGRRPAVVFLAAQKIAQSHRRRLIVQGPVLARAASLPHLSVNRGCRLWIAGRTKQIGFLQREQVIPGISTRQFVHYSAGLIVVVVAAQEQAQHDFFFFAVSAAAGLYTLSLHDALPI